MDGFKNTTKMKYMCGGPVRKATGGMIKSAAPKSVAKSAASAKQVPTPDLGSKRFIEQTRPTAEPKPLVNRPAPKDVGREFPRPTMEPKRLIAQTPPEDKGRELFGQTMEPKRPTKPTPPDDVRTIGGAPKNAKTMGGEPRRSDEGISAKRRLAGTAGDYAAPPEDVRTIGGAPKNAKTMGSISPGAKTMGSVSPGAKTMGSVSPGAKTMGSVSPAAKTMGNAPKAMKGVPVASKKPMIGQFKTGGYVSKSTFKW